MNSKIVSKKTRCTTPKGRGKKGVLLISSEMSKVPEVDKTVTGTKGTSSLNGMQRKLLKVGGQTSIRTIGEDDQSLEEEFANQVITPDIISEGLTMELEVLDASEVDKGTIRKIMPGGIAEGGRKKNDGCCIIGSGGVGEVDFNVPEIEGCAQRHFMIQYNVKRKAYYLKDLKEGTGISVRVNEPLVTLFS